LLVVVILSIPIFAIFADQPLLIKIISRLILVPVVAGIAFELLRLTAANYHRIWVRWLIAPSLALQRLTTREPEDGMIEVAIAAFAPRTRCRQRLAGAIRHCASRWHRCPCQRLCNRMIANALIAWFSANGRDLPWRHTRDPYRVLVAELMLQQTQVERVIPKYHAFLAQFPDVHTLASAPTSAVITAWQGLRL
jgi:hypothetical protein